MNRVLLTLLVLFATKTKVIFAQPCTISNIQVVSTRGNCTATISFDMKRNNGNKFIYLHVWDNQAYSLVEKSKFQKGHGPKKFDIDGNTNQHQSLATIAINNGDYSNPTISLLGYRPDATVTAVGGYSIAVSPDPVSGSGNKAFYRYTVSNIPLGRNVDGGCDKDNLAVAVWSTQANSVNSPIHCSAFSTISGQDLLSLSGSTSCITKSYTLNITNASPNSIKVDIDIYADNGGTPNDGIFDPGTGIIQDHLIKEYTNYTIAPNTTATITSAVPSVHMGYNLWAQVISLSNGSETAMLPVGACGPLPATLSNFTVSRAGNQAKLAWETVSEQQVQGFEVYRMTNGDWEKRGFISSRADGGISNNKLTYAFDDFNVHKGISQYRLKEISTDGKYSFSDIRAVKGEGGSSGFSLYPNPSKNGRINILFDDNATRDLIISDASGRIVKQVSGTANTNISIDNLKAGYFQLRVINRVTNEQYTQRFLVINP